MNEPSTQFNGNVTYQAGGFYEVPALDGGNKSWQGLSQSAALADAQRALTNSLVFPCIKNVNIFHCPGDTRITQPTGQGFAFRTYSKTQNYAGDTWDAGSGTEYCGMGTTILRASDITAPSMTFMAVEDTDWRGYNDGTWVVEWFLNTQPQSFRWIDPLGMYHIDANNWVFLDGHVETHKWKDQAAIAAGLQAAKGANMSRGFPAATSGYDYNYIRPRCAVSRLALTGGLVSFSAVL